MPLAPSRFANQQWKLPAFGGGGVSLNYVPQQQTIGDPRNQAVLDAAKLGLGGMSSAAPAARPVAMGAGPNPIDVQRYMQWIAPRTDVGMRTRPSNFGTLTPEDMRKLSAGNYPGGR